MKNAIILSVLIALSATVAAQTDTVAGYKSIFGHESTVWNGATKLWDFFYNHELHASVDTAINGINYKKIEYYDASLAYLRRFSTLDFYIREDTTTGKVWYRYTESALETPGVHSLLSESQIDTDFLLIDMSLGLGDSILLTHVSTGLSWYYVSSVAYVDSTKHITLTKKKWDGMNTTIEFIEGIGNIIYGVLVHQEFNTLVCCYKDGNLIYQNTDTANHPNWEYDGCTVYDRDGGGVVDVDNTVTISPNPCTSILNIAGENIQSASIFDIKGNIILQDIPVNMPIDLTGIPCGIYFVQILHSDTIFTRTIIKK